MTVQTGITKPKFQTRDVRALIKRVDPQRPRYEEYRFSTRTFTKLDVPGPNVSAHQP